MYLHNVYILILFTFSIIQYNYAIDLSSSLINRHEIKPRAPDNNTTTSITTTTTTPSIIPDNNNNNTTINKNTIIPTSTSSSSSNIIPTSTPSSNQLQNIITVSDTLELALECHLNQTDPYFCHAVTNSTIEAIKEVDEVMNLKTNITIKVVYFSFCEIRCNNESIGRGVPSIQFTFPYEDGTNFVVSQALAKQIVRPQDPNYVPTDITIEINHDSYINSVDNDKAHALGWNGTGVPPTGIFWFLNDTRYNQTKIESNQIDFRYIILHQIIHGLGFISGWAPYFWSPTSAFRQLVVNIASQEEMRIVTPAMNWYIDTNTDKKEDGGPLYIRGFLPTMMFDKFLHSMNYTEETPTLANLSIVGSDLQNFCVQDWNAFILHFLTGFSRTNQYQAARSLWDSMAEKDSLFFVFEKQKGYYSSDPYLKQYTNMTLLTGQSFMDVAVEQYDETNSRPTASIAHLDSKYNTTVDFLMTQFYIRGQTLEEITQELYQTIPPILYNTTVSPTNHTNITKTYTSPIGPGILHMLDAMGYATVLSNVTYTLPKNNQDGNKNKTCDDKIDSPPNKPKTSLSPSTSDSHHHPPPLLYATLSLLPILLSLLFTTL